MEYVLYTIVAICVYVIIGGFVLMPLIPRISSGIVWADMEDNTFKEIALWPKTLWFYTRKETIQRIGLAKHNKHPWAYDIDGSDFPKEIRALRLERQIKKELGHD